MIKLHKLSRNYFIKISYAIVELYKRTDVNTFELVLSYDFCEESTLVKFFGKSTNYAIAKKFNDICKKKYKELRNKDDDDYDEDLADE